MTAPFAPPPSRNVIVVLVALFAAMAVVPLGRRDDWLGWIALAMLVAANIVLWGLLIWGMIRRWREPSE